MSDVFQRGCQVCGGYDLTLKYENKLAKIDDLLMGYSVAHCKQCGFNFADKLPSVSVYEKYYASLSKYDVVLPKNSISAIDKYRAEQAVNFVKSHIHLSDLIVDIGCGSGTLLKQFQEQNFSYIRGVDPAPNAPVLARATHGLDCVETATLQQAVPNVVEQADLVCLMGVLEHLPALREDIKSIAAALNEHAKVLVEVPAAESFMNEDFEPFGEFSIEHIQYFTMQSLVTLFSKSGMNVVDTSIMKLEHGTTDSLMCLFEKNTKKDKTLQYEHDNKHYQLDNYINESRSKLRGVLDKIKRSATRPLIIFGAGSHTARLIPYLMESNIDERVVGVVDNNINLQGKIIERWLVTSPQDLISQHPDALLIISSFRSQHSLNDWLAENFSNQRLLLY